ncbi:EndoU domain-containing protein [Butyrivibrio sp. INlla21]|uniref:EndoU domain-containing protein n=1 Tax=Butyrivibrio sp. INlla21 TaxID=1520811 RepID=UPI0008E4C278|nr:EndoU domain-containing protein [Butyrivibrio sp. INlla21]SFU76953.1 EndoU nuclease [Butyrivibrio sp. INlla21]
MGNVEGTDVGGGHSRNGYATGYHPGGYNGSGYQSGGYTSSTSTAAIECESQTFKSHRDEWTTRNEAYDSYWMQRLDDYYNRILEIVDEANDAIDSSGIDFLDLGHIDKAYSTADVTDMEERRTNLVDFTSTVQEDVAAHIDRPFYQKLQALSTSMKDHAELNITYLGTPFDLPYNIADPQHLCDWLWKTEFGEEDDFLFTGDATKDTILREFTVYSDAADRYVYEDKMEDWENLSDDEKWAIKHLLSYNAGHWEEYYGNETSKYAQEYKNHTNRIINACFVVENVQAEYYPDGSPKTEAKRIKRFSDGGTELMEMCDKDSYEWELLNKASVVRIDLKALAEEVDLEDAWNYEATYGDRFSGADITITFDHDRAATTMTVAVTPVSVGADNAKIFYENNKDSFDKINAKLSEDYAQFYTDYRRCLNYIDKNAEMHPGKYSHQGEALGMTHARLALFLVESENHEDMECIDEMISSNGYYGSAFSVDATKLSDSGKEQIQKYVELVKNKAYSPYDPNNLACGQEITRLYAYFQEGSARSVTGYWPICKDLLTDVGTDLVYNYYGNENSEGYDPDFASALRMAELLIDGKTSIPTEAREAWLADEKHQQAYLAMLQIKNPDMFNPYWKDMSDEQRGHFGRICASVNEEVSFSMLASVDAEYRAEAYYYYGESSGFNAKASAIHRKIEAHTINDSDVGVTQVPLENYLTEEELEIVKNYITRYSTVQIMTQDQYEMLATFSSRIQQEYESKQLSENPLLAVNIFFDHDYLEYRAFKRRDEDDVLYLVSKEAKNTAYVHDESMAGKVVHTLDAVYHGATNLKKNFDDIDYALEKKVIGSVKENIDDKGSDLYQECETYEEYLDYKHSLETREYEQAKEFCPLGYVAGQFGMDLVLMWAGGTALEAAGATAATTEGLMSLGLSENAAAFVAGVAMEQVMPTILYVIPNGVNNYLNGMPLKDVLLEAFKQEAFNIILSSTLKAGQAKLFGNMAEDEFVILEKEASLAGEADDALRVVDDLDNILDDTDDFYEKLYESQYETIPEYEQYVEDIKGYLRDGEKLSHWENPPSEAMYLNNKEIFDNPNYFNQETGELVNNVKLLSESEKSLYSYRDVRLYEAENTNQWFVENVDPNYKPPYKPGTLVEEIELAEDTTFVRVYDNMPGGSGMRGGWIMRAEDIEGLTPLQIQEKFALPNTPKYICDVELEAGTHLRVGEANPLEGWGAGGGTQYDLMGQRVGNFTNERLLEVQSNGNTTIISKEMEEKILEGQRADPAKNKVIGGHSPKISNDNPSFAVEVLSVNADGTKSIKFIKAFPDGNISKIKRSTIFPDTWTDSEIIDAVRVTGDSPVLATRMRDGATLHRQIINGVEVEVIKIGDNVTSGYPTGKVNAPYPSGF